jgi:hypothetical protein
LLDNALAELGVFGFELGEFTAGCLPFLTSSNPVLGHRYLHWSCHIVITGCHPGRRRPFLTTGR